MAKNTTESILLCEAAGYDVIIVETVGVGQSEVEVKSITDFFLLLMLAGAGDELQGMKKGIMEMADMILINKADGDNINESLIAKNNYASAIQLFSENESGVKTVVETCSALTNIGINNAWSEIKSYFEQTKNNGFYLENRVEQKKKLLLSTLNNLWMTKLYSNPYFNEHLREFLESMNQNSLSPFQAADEILALLNNENSG